MGSCRLKINAVVIRTFLLTQLLQPCQIFGIINLFAFGDAHKALGSFWILPYPVFKDLPFWRMLLFLPILFLLLPFFSASRSRSSRSLSSRMKRALVRRTARRSCGRRKDRARPNPPISAIKTPICSEPFAHNEEQAQRSCCLGRTPRQCSCISMR